MVSLFTYLVGVRNADVKHAIGYEWQVVDSSGRADYFDGVQVGLVVAMRHHADVMAERSIQGEGATER